MMIDEFYTTLQPKNFCLLCALLVVIMFFFFFSLNTLSLSYEILNKDKKFVTCNTIISYHYAFIIIFIFYLNTLSLCYETMRGR